MRVISIFVVLFVVSFGSAVEWGYSGMVDVSSARSNGEGNELFYWLFPPRQASKSPPLILWLQGGPGASGMTGLLYEHGPVMLKGNDLIPRKIGSWNEEFAVLYVDSPVGTGFSVAGDNGFAKYEDDVVKDLYVMLKQVLVLHPEYAKSDFYITGESYGGHYVPAFAEYILSQGFTNLRGIAIGDGFTAPCIQIKHKAMAAYYFGLIDYSTMQKGLEITKQVLDACEREEYSVALDFRSELEELISEESEINMYDVRTFEGYGQNKIDTAKFLNQSHVMEKLGVGEYQWITDRRVGKNMKDDCMRSMADKFPGLLEKVNVLLFQGQFDLKDGVVSNDDWIREIDWKGKEKYLELKRQVWKWNGKPVGWFKEVENLAEVIIANAGHMAPMDQPEAALDMITRWIKRESYSIDKVQL